MSRADGEDGRAVLKMETWGLIKLSQGRTLARRWAALSASSTFNSRSGSASARRKVPINFTNVPSVDRTK